MVTLTACGSKDSGKGATYKDGTYVGQRKKGIPDEEAEVTIVDAK